MQSEAQLIDETRKRLAAVRRGPAATATLTLLAAASEEAAALLGRSYDPAVLRLWRPRDAAAGARDARSLSLLHPYEPAARQQARRSVFPPTPALPAFPMPTDPERRRAGAPTHAFVTAETLRAPASVPPAMVHSLFQPMDKLALDSRQQRQQRQPQPPLGGGGSPPRSPPRMPTFGTATMQLPPRPRSPPAAGGDDGDAVAPAEPPAPGNQWHAVLGAAPDPELNLPPRSWRPPQPADNTSAGHAAAPFGSRPAAAAAGQAAAASAAGTTAPPGQRPAAAAAEQTAAAFAAASYSGERPFAEAIKDAAAAGAAVARDARELQLAELRAPLLAASGIDITAPDGPAKFEAYLNSSPVRSRPHLPRSLKLTSTHGVIFRKQSEPVSATWAGQDRWCSDR